MRRSGSRLRLSSVWGASPVAAAAVVLASLAACDPPCDRTCDKLLSCDAVETPRVSSEDCRLQCERQEQLYDNWNDQELQDAFKAHKQCILAEECDALADGVCTDELLTSW